MSGRRTIGNTFVVNTIEDANSVVVQYAPNATPSSSQIHATFQTNDKYMRMRYTNETFSGNVDPNHPWVLIVGESGGETDYTFGISAQKTTASTTTAPSDISSWSGAPIATTTQKPYLWSKVQKKDGSGNNVGNPSYIRLTGEDGANGDDAVTVSLDNQHEDFIYAGATNRTGSVTCQCRLYNGTTEVTDRSLMTWRIRDSDSGTWGASTSTNANASISNASGSVGLLTITGLVASSVKIQVRCTYNSKYYFGAFTANKTSIDKYDLLLEPTAIPYNAASYETQVIKVKVSQTDLSGTTADITNNISTSTSTPSTGTLRLYALYKESASGSEVYHQMTTKDTSGNYPFFKMSLTTTLAGANNNVVIELRKYKSTSTSDYDTVDYQTIPINKAVNGTSPIFADLSNEMSGVACNENSQTTSEQTVVSEVTMWKGNTKQTITGVTCKVNGTTLGTSYGSSTSSPTYYYKVAISGTNSTTATVTIYVRQGTTITSKTDVAIIPAATIDGTSTTYNLVLTINGVRGGQGNDAVMYSLNPSTSSIVKKKDGTYDPTGTSKITCAVMKTVGDSTSTAPTGEYTLKYLKDDDSQPSDYPTNGIQVNTITSKLTFLLYDKATTPNLIDRETIPVVTDGEDSTSYIIRSSIDSIVIPSDQTSTSMSGVSVSFYKKLGTSGTEASYKGYYAVYRRTGTSYTLLTMSGSSNHGNLASITITATIQQWDAIVVFLFASSYYDNAPATQAYLAKKEIVIRKNGDTGEQGGSGENAHEVQPNILKGTVFDKGFQFVRNNWDGGSSWDYITVNGDSGNTVEGRKCVIISAVDAANASLYQNVRASVTGATWYTLSFWCKSTTGSYSYWSTYLYSTSSNCIDKTAGFIVDGTAVSIGSSNNDGHYDWAVSGTWTYHTITFKTVSSLPTPFNVMFRAQAEGRVFLCMPKLELGKVATSYIPHEQDNNGKVGRFYYYAQEWTDSQYVSYVVSEAQAPFFKYGNNYYVFNPDENGTYSMSAMNAPYTTVNGTVVYNKWWSIMTNDFKYIITEAIFGRFAHFGSFVINDDWMISTNGTVNGTAYTDSDSFACLMVGQSSDNRVYAKPYTMFNPDYPTGSSAAIVNSYWGSSGKSIASNVTDVNLVTNVSLKAGVTYWLKGTGFVTNTNNRLEFQVYNASYGYATPAIIYSTSSGSWNTDYFQVPYDGTYIIRAHHNTGSAATVERVQVYEYHFVPNFAVDGKTGKTYQRDAYIKGEIHATSGTFVGITANNIEVTNSYFSGEVYANSGTFNGTVKAKMFYSPTKYIADNYTINPANDPYHTFLTGKEGMTITLPSPVTYDGVEFQILPQQLTQYPNDVVKVYYANGIWYTASSGLFTMVYTVALTYNKLCTFKAIQNKWYVISGSVSAYT